VEVVTYSTTTAIITGGVAVSSYLVFFHHIRHMC
jgi:hypothetical protein